MKRYRRPGREEANIPECCKHLSYRDMLKGWFFRDWSFSDRKADGENGTLQKNPYKSGYRDLESGSPVIPLSSQRQAGSQGDFTPPNINTTRRASVEMKAERRGMEEERRGGGEWYCIGGRERGGGE